MFLLQYNKMIVRLPRLGMSNECVSHEELTRQRTPSKLWDWLTPERRVEIARKAALARWGK